MRSKARLLLAAVLAVGSLATTGAAAAGPALRPKGLQVQGRNSCGIGRDE
jgi:hypothetical protein